jgi:phage terminase large subunit-like protein
MRTRPIQARIRSGTVKFDTQAPWFFDFQEELCQFPRSKHDDQVDAFSWLGQLLNRMQAANTPQEDEDEEDQERKQGFQHQGRNKTTGY